ncbi:MAG: hypothetical protein IKK43_06010 [Clostridia bacterium]|nr:hypothetical protein [Clostridia bacterium]
MIERIRKEIFDFFPTYVCNFNDVPINVLNDAQEIRIRIGQPVNIRGCKFDFFVGERLRQDSILKLLEAFSDNSIYAVQSEINNGYITIRGGHRVGISGTCIIEDNKVKNIKYISSLNIRVAREVKECSNTVFKYISKKNDFENTLIISPPRMRKNYAS